MREEASRGSTALAAARSELAEEARWRTQLQQSPGPLLERSPGPLLQVEGDASMKSSHDDTLSSRTRGADAPAKRPLEGDSAAEVDARRSFVALYAPWY